MNEITWHESAIWFFIAQKLLFANQCYKISKFRKISKQKLKVQNCKKKIKILKI
jgi:hypothetical protein